MARQMKSAADVAAKWMRNTLANKESAKRGVEGVTENPMEKAAQAVDRYREGCAAAADNGTFVKGCRSVGIEDWKQAYIEKGLPALDKGVKLAERKITRFYDEYLPMIEAESERIQRMAKGGRANAMARIEANLDALERFKASRRR